MSDQNVSEKYSSGGDIPKKEVSEGKVVEVKITEEKIVEEKMAEDEMAEEKVAKEKMSEDEMAEEKVSEEKMSEDEMAEEKVSEEKVSEEKVSEEKVSEDEMAEEKTSKEKHIFYHLLGKTGSGKSSTGNTILGRKVFNTKSSFSAVTTNIEMESPEGRPDIVVVDGPGLVGVNTGLSNEAIQAIRQVVEHEKDAFHVFLIICRYGERFTEEDEEMVTRLKQEFGGQRALENHAIVVLTCGDNFERDTEDDGLTFEQWCRQQTGAFSDLRKWCWDRVLLVDNTKKQEQRETPFLSVLENETRSIRRKQENDNKKGNFLVQGDKKEEQSFIFRTFVIVIDILVDTYYYLFGP